MKDGEGAVRQPAGIRWPVVPQVLVLYLMFVCIARTWSEGESRPVKSRGRS